MLGTGKELTRSLLQAAALLTHAYETEAHKVHLLLQFGNIIGCLCRAWSLRLQAREHKRQPPLAVNLGFKLLNVIFWRVVSHFLKDPSTEQIACQAPKPILLDTGSVHIPYEWCATER